MIPYPTIDKLSYIRMADHNTYEFVSMACSYHEYQSLWSAVVGEELQCRIELAKQPTPFICCSRLRVGWRCTSRLCIYTNASMEDNGTISEKRPTWKRQCQSINRLEIFKKLHFRNTCDSANSVF